jgi:ABC-2 type transport system ATP-binding protein
VSTAIRVAHLAKRFGDVVAVDDVSFEVARGELVGLLGPNGAGKTTTLNLLTGLARPDAGAIRIETYDCARRPRAAQHLVGIVPDESNLYEELSGFDNLCFCAALYGMRRRERRERAAELLRSFGLADAAQRKFETYSKGMKRKLTLAAGIVHRPPILFLDEPTTGIDVAAARGIRQLVAELHRGGTTILLTTHYIEEAERLCDEVTIMSHGKAVAVGPPRALIAEHAGPEAVEVYGSPTRLTEVEGLARSRGWRTRRTGTSVSILQANGAAAELEGERRVTNLEDVFVLLTGEEIS